MAVGTTSGTCRKAPAERWQVITLQPQPDGKLAGDYVDESPAGCGFKRTVTFTRTGDVDVANLPDPASQAPRVMSPAEALHGRYHGTLTYYDGSKSDDDYVVRTDCLRRGERCISYLRSPDALVQLVFANGKWTRDNQWDKPCFDGATSHVTSTAELPLPQPPQDPITLLTGHGHLELSGSACADSGDYDARFERIGD